MDKKEIMNCIPHRDDMLILDEVTSIDETSAKGKYFVKGTEFFLNGHYPEKKIVPGTIICEMMAQLLAVYCSQRCYGLPVLTNINNASFKKMIFPNNQVDIFISNIEGTNRVIRAHGEVKVSNELCASTDLTVACLFK